jgi:uncharacterized protein YutE (UPF0331/DUF86 family)
VGGRLRLAGDRAGPARRRRAHPLAAFAESPPDYGDIVPALQRRGVLDAPLGERLQKLSGFRNILVHEYAAVDFALVHDKLNRLDELELFAAALEKWLTMQDTSTR